MNMNSLLGYPWLTLAASTASVLQFRLISFRATTTKLIRRASHWWTNWKISWGKLQIPIPITNQLSWWFIRILFPFYQFPFSNTNFNKIGLGLGRRYNRGFIRLGWVSIPIYFYYHHPSSTNNIPTHNLFFSVHLTNYNLQTTESLDRLPGVTGWVLRLHVAAQLVFTRGSVLHKLTYCSHCPSQISVSFSGPVPVLLKH